MSGLTRPSKQQIEMDAYTHGAGCIKQEPRVWVLSRRGSFTNMVHSRDYAFEEFPQLEDAQNKSFNVTRPWSLRGRPADKWNFCRSTGARTRNVLVRRVSWFPEESATCSAKITIGRGVDANAREVVVREYFGSLKRATVLLQKVQQIDEH